MRVCYSRYDTYYDTIYGPELYHPCRFYGYTPSKPGNIVGSVVFGLILIAQIMQGARKRNIEMPATSGFAAAIELAGYILRAIDSRDRRTTPDTFEAQYFLLWVGPTVLLLGILYELYLMDRMVSRLSPAGPIILGLISIAAAVVEGVGGGIVAFEESKWIGAVVTLVGVCVQVAVLIVLWVFLTMILVRIKGAKLDRESAFSQHYQGTMFRFWPPAIALSTVLVTLRTIYRLVALCAGDPYEVTFFILDGLLVALALIVLTIVYPPAVRGNRSHLETIADEDSGDQRLQAKVSSYGEIKSINDSNFEEE